MEQEAKQFGEQQAVREAALGVDQQRADIAKAAETRQTTEGAADLALRKQIAGQGQSRVDIAEREVALQEEIADRAKTPAEIAKAEAELRQTQLENVKIIAETEDI
jgi:hypothetical protein